MHVMSFQNDATDHPEVHTTLTEASLIILEESLKSQFEDPSGYTPTDFLQTFHDRYNATMEEMSDDFDEDAVMEVKELRNQFVVYVELLFTKKLNIGFVELEDLPWDEQFEILHETYKFFVLNISRNIYNFAYSYILKNKKTLASTFPKVKTVAFKRMADIISDSEMCVVLSNITDTLQLALNDDSINCDEFLKMIREGEESYPELEFFVKRFDEFEITGNFVDNYREMLPDWCVVEIETQLMTKLATKYKVKKEEI